MCLKSRALASVRFRLNHPRNHLLTKSADKKFSEISTNHVCDAISQSV